MTTSYDYNHFINGHPPDDELVRLALTDMQKSGLSAASLEEAKVIIFNGNHQELNKKLGFTSLNGHSFLGNGKLVIEIPYFNEDGSVSLYRYKLIPSIENGNGEKVKYLHPKGKPAIPYILPKVRAVKDKRNKPLCITEGEKKASKLIQHGMAAIALPGVWSFKAGKDSQDEESKYIWSDLLKFRLDGRTVFLAFDSDLWTNPNVRAALYELAFKLKAKGALVRFVKWPASQGKGIDDYLTNNQDPGKELSKLEEAALDINDDGALPFDHKPAILRAYIMAKPGMSKGTKEWFILVLSQAWGIAKETIELEISDIEKKISPSIEWEDPIPFNDYSSLPDFPLDGMPSLEQEIVKIGFILPHLFVIGRPGYHLGFIFFSFVHSFFQTVFENRGV